MTNSLGIVIGFSAVVIVVTLVARSRRRFRSRRTPPGVLAPGVYFLTSDGCDTCARARALLDKNAIPYEELSWQREATTFELLGVDAVPSVVVVVGDGTGRWWRGGVPAKAQMTGLGRRAG